MMHAFPMARIAGRSFAANERDSDPRLGRERLAEKEPRDRDDERRRSAHERIDEAHVGAPIRERQDDDVRELQDSETARYGQLAGAGCGKNGSTTAAMMLPPIATNTVARNLSARDFTAAFQLA